MSNVRTILRKILIEILELDKNNLPELIDVNNSENWDSLGHFQIIERVEREFNIEIEDNKIVELLGEKEILDFVIEKLS